MCAHCTEEMGLGVYIHTAQSEGPQQPLTVAEELSLTNRCQDIRRGLDLAELGLKLGYDGGGTVKEQEESDGWNIKFWNMRMEYRKEK